MSKTISGLITDIASPVSEEHKTAILKIKKWVRLVCRNKCIDSNNVFISPFSYVNNNNETVHKTLICIQDNLPNGPVIQIPKQINEIGLDDLLSCYKLINYCSNKD